jgi:hypothetical protein
MSKNIVASSGGAALCALFSSSSLSRLSLSLFSRCALLFLFLFLRVERAKIPENTLL